MDILEISDIRTDGGTQMRAQISAEKVSDYAGCLEDGVIFPPVVVYYDGSVYWLADGFHRLAAHEQITSTVVHADVYAGTREDAIRFALRANAAHGKDRSPGDMRRCYQAAIENGFCEPYDANGVKALLRCTSQWARKLTSEARANHKHWQQTEAQRLADVGKTQREIAEAVGVDQKTICNWLEEKRNSFVIPQSEPESTQPEAPEQTPADHPDQTEAPKPPRSPEAQAWHDEMDQKLADAYVELGELKAIERSMRGQILPGIPNDDPKIQAALHHVKVLSALGDLVDVIKSHPPTPFPIDSHPEFSDLWSVTIGFFRETGALRHE